MSGHRLYVSIRHLVQILVILLFAILPWLNRQGLEQISGSLFAFDLAGIPFADPVAGVQAFVAAIIAGSSPGWRILAGAGLALGIAFFLGRVFCSWICPYGFLSEILHKARKAGDGNSSPAIAGKAVANRVFAAKAGLALLALAIVCLGFFPALTLISMPGQLSILSLQIHENLHVSAKMAQSASDLAGASAASGLADAFFLPMLAGACGLLLLPCLVLLAELVSGQRLWCRFACPQSVLLGLAARLLPRKVPGLRIAWQPRLCNCGKDKDCSRPAKMPCQAACDLACDPRHANGPERRDCTACGACLTSCQKDGNGALEWRFRPVDRK